MKNENKWNECLRRSAVHDECVLVSRGFHAAAAGRAETADRGRRAPGRCFGTLNVSDTLGRARTLARRGAQQCRDIFKRMQ